MQWPLSIILFESTARVRLIFSIDRKLCITLCDTLCYILCITLCDTLTNYTTSCTMLIKIRCRIFNIHFHRVKHSAIYWRLVDGLMFVAVFLGMKLDEICEIRGNSLSGINVIETRNEITELLKPELPVLRAKARVLQEDFANKIEISRQTYSSIETDKRTASWTIVLALIAYFQKKEETSQMLNQIKGIFEKLQMVMDITPNRKL